MSILYWLRAGSPINNNIHILCHWVDIVLTLCVIIPILNPSLPPYPLGSIDLFTIQALYNSHVLYANFFM